MRTRVVSMLCRLAAVLCLVSWGHVAQAQTDQVSLVRTPNGGIQPQTAVDSKGRVHIVYFKGDERAGDLYYAWQSDTGQRFMAPIRVNSESGTALAVGTVRVANISIGQDDRVFISWNGLGPKNPNGYPEAYAAFTRLNDARTAFEPQRNLSTWAKGLDGGGSVAADKAGNVYVVWHALAGAKDEAGRAVFVSHSADNGKTFGREKQANPAPTGACGCCGLRAFVDAKGSLYVMYRSAVQKINRDSMLLVSTDHGVSFHESLVDRWSINTCPMSTYAFGQAVGGGAIATAWETEGRVLHAIISTDTASPSVSRAIREAGDSQKHPSVAVNSKGETLVAWVEGTGWQRGGSLAWQVYDSAGRPTSQHGRAPGVPAWGLPTAYATETGFEIVF